MLHSFQKKGRKTAKSDAEIARIRYRAVARDPEASGKINRITSGFRRVYRGK